MKNKIYISILIAGMLPLLSVRAQNTTLGNINLQQMPFFNHDSTQCMSVGAMNYTITIAHAFLGDSLKIVNTDYAMLIDTATNYLGQNPWVINYSLPASQVYDQDMNNTPGWANIYIFGTKIILQQHDSIQTPLDTMFNINNSVGGIVNNPCMFGNISGKIYIDNNSNCIFDGTDVPLQGVNAAGLGNLAAPSAFPTTSHNGYTDGSGNYVMAMQQTYMTNFTVQIPSNYQFIFPSTSCSPVMYTGTSLPQLNYNFSLQCTSNVDVQCYANSPGIARPNKAFFMFPYVSNTGCDSVSGQLKMVLDSRVVYNAGLSSNPASSIHGDTLIWNYTNLTNLTNGAYWNSFGSAIHLTPNLSVHQGDTLCFRVMTNIPSNDLDPTNNDYTICLPVVNSYDPNVKSVSPKGRGPQGDIPVTTDVLTYSVSFQNTGNAPALNISIIDTLDSDIMPRSLKILGSSHNVSPEWLAPGIVKFNFYNINLADSTSNEAASHGSIRFSVKLNSGLLLGTKIKNTADIYFDYNAAVVTNTTLNTIASVTGIEELAGSSASVKVYPNPFSDNTTFVMQSDKLNETYSFEMYDLLGKQVKSIKQITGKEFQISRSGLENGVYFYKIYTAENTVSIGKLVIQ